MKIKYAVIAVIVLAIGVTIWPKNTQLLSPASDEKSVFSRLIPKLQAKSSSYSVYEDKGLIPSAYAESNIDNVSAYAVIDFDSGKVLAQSNLSKQIPVASLTKLLTAAVALDLMSPDEVITITPHAANMIPTKIGLIAGEKMTLRELLHASLLTSANDATQAIADGIDAKYGEPVFIRSMNEKAALLNLKHSHFTNPQGFDDPDHYSSVEDLAIISHYAMQYPVIQDIVKQESAFLPSSAEHKQFDLPNWNGVLGVYPDTIGMKIGNTPDAMFTSIVLSQRAGKKILAIVLGAQGSLDRDMKISELLDLGYEMTLGLQPVNITEEQLQEKYATWNAYFNQ